MASVRRAISAWNCISNTSVGSGTLERKWIAFFASMRSRRDINHGFEPPLRGEERERAVQMAPGGIDQMERLITMENDET